MENMIDLIIESNPTTNPALTSAWQSLRPSFAPDPTPAEQADLAQQGSDYFDDINLNL
ncbi:hypothetical protein Bca101_026274 [Brassica carinata]